MIAFVFPGQGSQQQGMGKDLYDKFDVARGMFDKANRILGFDLTNIMFYGSDDELKHTRVTQPSVFLVSVILAEILSSNIKPDMVAGHSLGEFSALVANKTLSFEDGLKLVYHRATAMQKACDKNPSSMAAILNVDDNVIEDVCKCIDDDIVVIANYNTHGQTVISGTFSGIERALAKFNEMGYRRTIQLKVGGAFHSPLMESAHEELEKAIFNSSFHSPICPIYQNINSFSNINNEEIKLNLVRQLTSPVLWKQSVERMIADGATQFIEVGNGSVLQGLIKKINSSVIVTGTEQYLK